MSPVTDWSVAPFALSGECGVDNIMDDFVFTILQSDTYIHTKGDRFTKYNVVTG